MALIGVISRVLNNGEYSILMGTSVLSVVLWHLIVNIPGPYPPLSPEALIFDIRLLGSTLVFASVSGGMRCNPNTTSHFYSRTHTYTRSRSVHYSSFSLDLLF